MKILEIRDNGGETCDRYHVVYDEMGNFKGDNLALGMNDRPFHPQGFCQHGHFKPGDYLGKLIRFDDLPPDCQQAVLQDMMDDDE